MTIAEKQAELAEMIREESWAQVELWKRVPWLALQADGRTGYSDAYARAYRQGYWAVAQEGGSYTVYVDLDTGDLVNASFVSQLAEDSAILTLQLDAAELIADLEKDAKRPTWKGYDRRAQTEWRDEIARTHGLTERYERGGPRTDLPFVWDD